MKEYAFFISNNQGGRKASWLQIRDEPPGELRKKREQGASGKAHFA
ncbi:hypothetical protein APA386B_905 [Acetobacter pasteurianus 386B]|nr:hypothetical protein APA386B_905 [Acetobacter pasteurianus 386B]